MMIDSVVWAQYINVTDRHTDSHVAVANAALCTGVGWHSRGRTAMRPFIDLLSLVFGSSRIKDTLDHTQTPVSSVNTAL